MRKLVLEVSVPLKLIILFASPHTSFSFRLFTKINRYHCQNRQKLVANASLKLNVIEVN